MVNLGNDWDELLKDEFKKEYYINLREFLKENEINNDYDKGYFLHLVTDYIFYNKFLECFSKDIYNDYDVLNEKLQEKYNVNIPESIRKEIFYKKGKTVILEMDKVVKFIEEVSDYKLSEIKEKVLEDDKYWLEFRKLPRI